MGKNNSRIDTLAADQAMIDGLTQNQSKLPTPLIVGSQTVTPLQLITLFQGRVTAAKAVVTAEAAHAAAVKVNNEQRRSTAMEALSFKRLLVAMFSGSPQILGDFGVAQPKVVVKSAATKARAAAKGLATRKTLGTKGPMQKKAALAQEHAPIPAPAVGIDPPAVSAPAVKPAS